MTRSPRTPIYHIVPVSRAYGEQRGRKKGRRAFKGEGQRRAQKGARGKKKGAGKKWEEGKRGRYY